LGICSIRRFILPDLREGLLASDRERPQATGGSYVSDHALQVVGDPKALEQFASDSTEKAQGILEAAKRHGLIAHRFYGSDDGGSLMVLDEWPDRQNFESFSRSRSPRSGRCSTPHE